MFFSSIELQPKIRGWLLACVDGKRQGYIPANYVKVLGKRRGTRHFPQSSTTSPSSGTSMPAPVLPSGDGGMNQAWSSQMMQTQNSHTSSTILNETMENTFVDVQSDNSGFESNQNPLHSSLSDRPKHSNVDIVPGCSTATSSNNCKSEVQTNKSSKDNLDKEDNKE